MEDNPYRSLAGAFAGEGSGGPKLRIGTVTSVSPLTLSIGGLPVGVTELRWNAALLAHDETVQATGLSGSVADTAIPSGQSFNTGSATAAVRVTPAAIKTGDVFLTFSEDDQSFLVLCKVV